MYYKGGNIRTDMSRQKVFDEAKDMIKALLVAGKSLPAQVEIYKEQLDKLNMKIYGKIDMQDGSNLPVINDPGRWHKIMYVLNVAALLILKAIPEDEYNGTLVIMGSV